MAADTLGRAAMTESDRELRADGGYTITTGPTGGQSAPYAFGASYYFPNIESFPGELFVRPPLTSARREGRIGRAAAVRQARHLERTNEHLRGGLDKRSNMVVGAALRVMPQPNWKLLADAAPGAGITAEWAREFARQCYRWFNDWGYDTRLYQDAEGHYNFGGLMWMAFRGLEGPDAETVGVIHYDPDRAVAYRTKWATYVTLVDPDRVSTPPELSVDQGVFEGRELDVNGRMTAIHILKGHPNDGGVDGSTWARVPRENDMGRPMAWQFFRKVRPGAQRGMTSWITILRGSTIFDQFDDAMLGNATKAASLATYIKTASSAKVVSEQMAPAGKMQPSEWDMNKKLGYYGDVRVRLGNQRLVVMPPEDEIVMQGMENTISDPSGFRNGFLRMFASALGISFEQVSNNFSEANYSSARAALLEVWRGVIADRKFFTSHVCSLVYSAVIEEAIAKGWIKLPAGAPDFYEFSAAYTNCQWVGPGMGWIDPQKEANAQSTRLANRTTTRQKEIAEVGDDWEEVFEQLGEEDEFAEEVGISLTVVPQSSANQAGNLDPEGNDTAGGGNPDQTGDEPTPARQKSKPAKGAQ